MMFLRSNKPKAIELKTFSPEEAPKTRVRLSWFAKIKKKWNQFKIRFLKWIDTPPASPSKKKVNPSPPPEQKNGPEVKSPEVKSPEVKSMETSLLYKAVLKGETAQVRKLLSQKKQWDDNFGELLLVAFAHGHMALAKYFMDHSFHLIDKFSTPTPYITNAVSSDGRTVFHYAAFYGNIAIMRQLLEIVKMDEEFYSINLLINPYQTTKEEKRRSAQLLSTKNKEDFNEKVKKFSMPLHFIDHADQNGNTPLHIAAERGHDDIFILLLKALEKRNTVFFQKPLNTDQLDLSTKALYQLTQYVYKRKHDPRGDHYTTYGKYFRCSRTRKLKAVAALKHFALHPSVGTKTLQKHRHALTEFHSDLGSIRKSLRISSKELQSDEPESRPWYRCCF